MKQPSFLALFLFPFSLLAVSQGVIDQWYDTMNILIHKDSAESMHSDLGVHFLGGSGTVRNRVYDINPIHISLPTFSAGCGGIDYTMGAINIASKDEMINALKSIMSNAGSYAFLLGLEVVSPMMSDVTTRIQDWSNQFNGMNVNSCEIGASLVQGIWPQSEASKKYVCQNVATTLPQFKDLIETRHKCHEDGALQEKTEKKAAQNSDLFAGNYNVAYAVLRKFPDLDPLTKQLFLNLTGTVISQRNKTTFFPPKGEDVFKVIEYGGVIKGAYKFVEDSQDPLFAGIVLEDLVIPPEQAWNHKVLSVLRSLEKKILEERNKRCTLTEEEKAFLRGTKFPIGSLTSLMAQWGGRGASLTSLTECADIISMEKVSDFLRDVLTSVLARAESLRSAQVDPETLQKYIDNLELIRQDLNHKQSINYQRMSAKHDQIRFLLEVDRSGRDQARGEF
ncbi:MAG: conjugal transfer protein TraH [Chlamydiia bacterium]|nr:conjugal transfer protein TraH [Chlamydiia bacterium]